MNTTTTYLGLTLPHPFIAGASPLGYRLETIKRLEDAGCAAVVLHSLFEEQITRDTAGRIAHIALPETDFADIVSMFPKPGEYPLGPDEYAAHIARVKSAVSIPIIASLNGRTPESWLRFARILEQAGADALELNMYDIPTDVQVQGATVESQLVGVVTELKRLLRIPVAVKLSPFFTAVANVAHRLDAAGADALVMFNRFYQPDIDIRTLGVSPQAELSTSAELPLRLRWLAILYGRVRCALAATGGIAEPPDGIKTILAGADVIQLVSTILRHGPSYVATMRRGLEDWLKWHNMTDLSEARGAVSLQKCPDATAFERAHYIRTLHSWTK